MIKSNRTRNRKIKEERDLVNNLFSLDQGIKSDTSLVNSSQSFRLNNKSQESYISVLTSEKSNLRKCPDLALTDHQPHPINVLVATIT